MENSVILEMEHITKVFAGVRALNNVRFRVEKGEIHALVGENGAGKSTLMKILIGLIHPEMGTITFKGNQVRFKNTADALNSGISMIHQEISLVQEMNVAENIWLGRTGDFTKYGFINKKKCVQKTKELLDDLRIDLDPKSVVKDLSVAQMQLVELARAVSYRSDIIIMDEPTSALTQKEIDILYRVARNLSGRGVSIIFISHKIEEILTICSKATILRDGTYIDTIDTKSVDNDALIKMVVGRELKDMFVKGKAKISGVLLEVKNLTDGAMFRDINFAVRKGEILGMYGLMGAGRTEIMRAIFGLDKFSKGQVLIDGKPVKIHSPKEAIAYGLGYIPEDRLRLGAFYTLSIVANTTIASFRNICNAIGLFQKRNELKLFEKQADTLSIKYASPNDLMGQLSGGNQQKVIVSRWLLTNPRVLILDEPTRGIDVGAKAEIHALISKMVSNGIAVLMVSSELPEILAISDRVLVVRNGRIVSEFSKEEATQENLVKEAFGM